MNDTHLHNIQASMQAGPLKVVFGKILAFRLICECRMQAQPKTLQFHAC